MSLSKLDNKVIINSTGSVYLTVSNLLENTFFTTIYLGKSIRKGMKSFAKYAHHFDACFVFNVGLSERLQLLELLAQFRFELKAEISF